MRLRCCVCIATGHAGGPARPARPPRCHARHVYEELWVVWGTAQGPLQPLGALVPGSEDDLGCTVAVLVQAADLWAVGGRPGGGGTHAHIDRCACKSLQVMPRGALTRGRSMCLYSE